MSKETDLLVLMQWLSPSFPTSSYAYSHGLEAAIAGDHITGATDLQNWLTDILTNGTGRNDAMWLRLAHAADTTDALEDLNSEARAFCPALTRLRESEKQGAAFVQTVNAVWGSTLPPLLLPLAVGAATRHQDAEIDVVVSLYLHSFVSSLISAAQRLMPLGQTDAQALLTRLHPICHSVAQSTGSLTLEDISSTTFLSDIAAMRHETLEPRIFHS